MSSEARRPQRPSVPPTLYALICVWLTERALLREGKPLLEGSSGKGALAFASMALAAALLMRLARLHASTLPLLLGSCTVAALLLGSLTLEAGSRFVSAMSSTRVEDWVLEVTSDPSKTDYGYRCRASAHCAGKPAGDVWLSLKEAPSLRDELRCTGRFIPLGESDFDTSARMQGVWGTIRVARVKERRAPSGLMGVVCSYRSYALGNLSPGESEERALLAGCVCGSREALRDYGLDKLFSTCGMAHLVAVSGGHLSILASLLTLVLEHAMARPKLRFSVLALVSGLFVLSCGAPISAIRSWLMTVLSMAATLLGRRSHALSALCAIALAMALCDPAVTGQLGYLLSVLSVGGLCLLSTYAGYALLVLVGRPFSHLPLPHKARRWLGLQLHRSCIALGVTLVAQITTLPLTAASFGEVSLVAPIAGLVVSGPFTLFVGLGLVATALSGTHVAGPLLLALCDLVAKAILAMLRWMGGWPHAKLVVEASVGLTAAVVCAFVAILVLWPKVSRRVVAGGLAFVSVVLGLMLVRWRYFAPACVRVLDVGQGDAILIQDGGSAVLVDTGPDEAVVAALARGHVLHLDAVVITHLHDDHYGGLDDLLGSISCERVYVAKGTAQSVEGELREAVVSLTGEGPRELAYGDALHVGDFCLQMVWPREEVPGNENAHSIELALRYECEQKRLSGLLTGDAEQDETGAVIAAGDVGDIDLLKVGHHGSEVSIREADARVLDAELAVASAGKDNEYGHPAPRCVQILKEAGSTFVCTIEAGDVEVRPGEQGPEVITQREVERT